MYSCIASLATLACFCFIYNTFYTDIFYTTIKCESCLKNVSSNNESLNCFICNAAMLTRYLFTRIPSVFRSNTMTKYFVSVFQKCPCFLLVSSTSHQFLSDLKPLFSKISKEIYDLSNKIESFPKSSNSIFWNSENSFITFYDRNINFRPEY